LCCYQPKKRFTTKAQRTPRSEKALLALQNVCLRLCDLRVFVVNFAVFQSVWRCHMAADADLNERNLKSLSLRLPLGMKLGTWTGISHMVYDLRMAKSSRAVDRDYG
jgi:hypothetical protein